MYKSLLPADHDASCCSTSDEEMQPILGPCVVGCIVVLPGKENIPVKQRINQHTYCMKCREALDGPCFEHTSPGGIIYDKPPIPLAYSSLPNELSISGQLHDVDEDKTIIAKGKIGRGMLLGPLIAPLVPVNEVEKPSRYVLWSEDTQELLAHDLRCDYSCNWIKFMQPSRNCDEINVMAYQQRGSLYFVTLKEILPDSELRVYVKITSCCKLPRGWTRINSLNVELFDTQDFSPMSPVEPETSCDELSEEPADTPINTSLSPTAFVGRRNGRPSGSSTKWKKYRSPPDEERQRMQKLYEEGGLTEGEKEQYERDVVRWQKMDENYQQTKLAMAAKRKAAKQRYENGEMTAEEIAAYEEKRRRERKQCAKTYRKSQDRRIKWRREQELDVPPESPEPPQDRPHGSKSYRWKIIKGVALTAKEKLQYEKSLVVARKHYALKAMKKRVAKGKAPLDFIPKPGVRAPMYEWQKAAVQATNAAAENLDGEALGAPKPLESYSQYALSFALSHSVSALSKKGKRGRPRKNDKVLA